MKRILSCGVPAAILLALMLFSCDSLPDNINDGVLYVYFDSNEGTGSMNPFPFNPNESKDLPENTGEISRNGYRFISWNTSADRTGKEYIQKDNVTLNNECITLYAQWYKDYNLGDIGPGGGLIFYRYFDYYDIFSYPDWLYLEVAPESSEVEKKWGEDLSGYVVGSTKDEPGSGSENTEIITNKFNGDYAAHYCKNLNLNNFIDWYLPSRNELAYMHHNLHKQGLGSFKTDKNYWSSHQIWNNTSFVYFMKFDVEINPFTFISSSRKNFTYLVRAVRKI